MPHSKKVRKNESNQSTQWTTLFLFLLAASSVFTILSNVPMVGARPVSNTNYRVQRQEKNAAEVMRRGLQNACNNSVQTWFPLNSVTATPYFGMVNGRMIGTAVGPTGTAYPGMFANSFDDSDNPEHNNIRVDANTYDLEANFVIPTSFGPVFCYDTLTAVAQIYCAPYDNNLIPRMSLTKIAYFQGNSQRRAQGVVGPNNDYIRFTYESNAYDGVNTHFQAVKRDFTPDTFVAIDTPEILISTDATANNIYIRDLINPDNSGNFFWQRTINGKSDIVKRSYNGTGAFIDPSAVTVTNTTLPGYDCELPMVYSLPNGQAKLSAICAQKFAGRYDLFIQDLTVYPNFQLNGLPVNITGNLGWVISSSDYAGYATQNGGIRFAIAARPGSLSALYKGFTFETNPDNTINGNVFGFDPNSYAQYGMTIVKRSNTTYTIGYQGNSKVLLQTFHDRPFIGAGLNFTINELAYNQTVNLKGVFLGQTTYQPNQITVTITVSPSIMVIYTTSPLPANAASNYASDTGTLTLSVNGSTSTVDMANLLCGLAGDVQAYERQSGTMALSISDDSGFPTYNATVPIYIVTQNYTPFFNSAPTLYVGQNNRSHFNLDIGTQDHAPLNQIHVFVTNPNPSAATVEYINATSTQQGVTQYTFDQNNQIWAQQLGGNNAPQFKIGLSSYNGQPSTPVDVNVYFFPTPQIITRQITYNAKKRSDRTPLAITNVNFNAIGSNSPEDQQIWTYYYKNNYAQIYQSANLNVAITQCTQAQLNNVTNPVLEFIPDGSGKVPEIWTSFSDGYNTLPSVPVDIHFTVTPSAGKNNYLTTVLYAVILRVAAALIQNYLCYRRNKFANFVRSEGNFGYFSFESVPGAKFANLVDTLASQVQIKDVVINKETGQVQGQEILVQISGKITSLLLHYAYLQACFPNIFAKLCCQARVDDEKEIKRIAKAFAKELKKYRDVEENIVLRILHWLLLGGIPLKQEVEKWDKDNPNLKNMASEIEKLINDPVTEKGSCLKIWECIKAPKDKPSIMMTPAASSSMVQLN